MYEDRESCTEDAEHRTKYDMISNGSFYCHLSFDYFDQRIDHHRSPDLKYHTWATEAAPEMYGKKQPRERPRNYAGVHGFKWEIISYHHGVRGQESWKKICKVTCKILHSGAVFAKKNGL